MKKLIRDKIPEIMKKNQQNPQIEIIQADSEYQTELHKKFIEETQEYIEASAANNDIQAQEEIADILEVLDAICELHNYNMNQIIHYKFKKKEERGGFEKRILLTLE